MMCKECYSEQSRATPLRNPIECLKNHTQYICGSCGRCICIEHTEKGLQRWNFPFKSLEIAKLYLRTADYTAKKPCGIYKISKLAAARQGIESSAQIKSGTGTVSFKIFLRKEDLLAYLKKNPDKICVGEKPVFSINEYTEFPNTEIRKLTAAEAEKYLTESLHTRAEQTAPVNKSF